MKTRQNINFKIAGIVTALFFLFMSEAMIAQYGHTHRATRRRTAVVVSSATHEKDQQQYEQQQQQQQQAAAAATPAPTSTTPPPSTAPLAIGAVVPKLPSGCVSTPVNGQEYYNCGSNYYRAVYQENSLVYITVDPPQ